MTHAALGSLVKIVGGGTPTRTNPAFYGGDIPWVTPKDMKSWEIDRTQISLTRQGVKSSSAKVVPAGAVLVVVRSGVLKHSLPVGIARRAVAINQDMKALLCGESIYPDYLAHLLKARANEVLSWVRATTADNFPLEKLREMPISLPSLQKQRRIADILDRAHTLRAKRGKALAHLNELTESIFLDMFGNADAAPPIALGELLTFVTSGGRGWARYYAESGRPFIRSFDVRANAINGTGLAYVRAPDNAEPRRTEVRAKDTLLTITGSLIGRAAPVPKSLHGAYVSQHVAILRPDHRRLCATYLSHFLNLPHGGQRQIAATQYGQTKPGLNFDQIRRFVIPLPPVDDQKLFARRVERIEESRLEHLSQPQAFDELFLALQERAFTGEL